ncbi:unnamed protein product [Brassica rapa subsp. narinosa]
MNAVTEHLARLEQRNRPNDPRPRRRNHPYLDEHGCSLMRTVPIPNHPIEKSLDLPKPDERVDENIGSKEMGVQSGGDAERMKFLDKGERTSSLTHQPLLERSTRTPMLNGRGAWNTSSSTTTTLRPGR